MLMNLAATASAEPSSWAVERRDGELVVNGLVDASGDPLALSTDVTQPTPLSEPGGHFNLSTPEGDLVEVAATVPLEADDLDRPLDLLASWSGGVLDVSWTADPRFLPVTLSLDGQELTTTSSDSWSGAIEIAQGADLRLTGWDGELAAELEERRRTGDVEPHEDDETPPSISLEASVRLGEPVLASAVERARTQRSDAAQMLVNVRHQTFINEQAIFEPPFEISNRCYTGNDRSFDPNSPEFKSRVDVNLAFSATGVEMLPTRTVPPTIRYSACTPDPRPGLQAEAAIPGLFDESRSASTDGISVTLDQTGSNAGRAQYSVDHSATLPFGIAPAIDYAYDELVLTMGSFTVQGSHDRAPSHEIYIGDVGSEWVPVYQFTNEGFSNLAPLPGTTATINITL